MEFSLLDAAGMQSREDADLAGYAMHSRHSRGRAHAEPPPRLRTVFQRDRDRIVHSTAFRRLEYKTQVFVNHEGDHYRTRLTHSLEVMQISRSVARALRLNEDLVEAVSLCHDLGHSPFGHAGEEALDELLESEGGFNHNRQTLRVVDRLERRYPEFEGLNLSWEIRESIAKHGEKPDRGLLDDFDPSSQPLLEAQLVDVADSLAYSNHDVDDGLRSGFIQVDDLREVSLWRDVETRVVAETGLTDTKLLVARVVSHLIDLQVTDLTVATLRRLEENGIDSVEKVRSHGAKLVDFSPQVARAKSEMDDFLKARLYRHYRTLKMAEKAKRFIRDIFNEYVRNPQQLPPSHQARLASDGKARVICDYIAGMTDRYCQDEYKRLFHPFERV